MWEGGREGPYITHGTSSPGSVRDSQLMSSSKPSSKSLSDDSLGSWLSVVTGLTKFTPESISKFLSLPPCDALEGCTPQELEAVLLYFVVKRRLFDGTTLSTENILFLRAVQRDLGLIHQILELRNTWHHTWNIT